MLSREKEIFEIIKHYPLNMAYLEDSEGHVDQHSNLELLLNKPAF